MFLTLIADGRSLIVHFAILFYHVFNSKLIFRSTVWTWCNCVQIGGVR